MRRSHDLVPDGDLGWGQGGQAAGMDERRRARAPHLSRIDPTSLLWIMELIGIGEQGGESP